ncbi:hypothetical protein PSTG_05821 [Puccinia striiformis f. sp. tritici PST-78]|uniref:Uncharacterized protein n=1 Tax=Puccinia striiformis f. sp. tritici PST-78 TaxID=1165861 RepID=A0A0L0VNS4_9BASI|nr:hypothetical protein PSTG_05821 [Puccinia striiformis f. sp. tritici PST-78]
MHKKEPTESVASMMTSFESKNPDEKTAEEYQGMIRGVLSHLHEQMNKHVVRRTERGKSWLSNDIPYRLGQILLPALREKLSSLSVALNSSDSPIGTKSWWIVILNSLIEIDDVLRQIEKSIILIWRILKPVEGALEDHTERLVRSKAKKISHRIQNLLATQVCQVIDACNTFFDNITSSSIPSILSTGEEINHSIRAITVTINEIMAIIEWIPKPRRGQRKMSNDILPSMWIHYPEFWDHEYPELDPSETMEASKAAIPIIKLCRLYFNKLLRTTNTQSPFFALVPSIEKKEDQLKQFLKHANVAQTVIKDFMEKISPPRNRLDIPDSITTLHNVFRQLSPILERYWASLLTSDDPKINRVCIVHAQRWLESWSSMFLIASEKLVEAAGADDPFHRDIFRRYI